MIKITDWHIVISGFTQHEGQMHGCMHLAQTLRALSSPTTFVGLREWDSNWDRLAEYITLVGEPNARIRVYAYSWGCGNGLVSLATALCKRSLSIEHAVLCDPVYYSRVKLWLARFIGVLRRGTITIPSCVRRVSWLRQFENIPGGCDLEGDAALTSIDAPIELKLRHEQMDEAEDFHRLALQVAGLAIAG